MQRKTKKILNIVVDVVVAVVLIAVLALTVNTLVSQKKGYVPLFGTTRVAVLSDSMEGDRADNFSKGDLLTVKLLKGDARESLKVGQIVTFYMNDPNGNRIINTHRIVEIKYDTDDGTFRSYITKGDNADGIDGELFAENVIGVYKSHAKGLGNVTLWFRSPTGFFVCVVLPSLLIVFYCVYLVVKASMAGKKKREELDEKERMRREIMAELGIDPEAAKLGIDPEAANAGTADASAEPNPTAEEAEQNDASLKDDGDQK